MCAEIIEVSGRDDWMGFSSISIAGSNKSGDALVNCSLIGSTQMRYQYT